MEKYARLSTSTSNEFGKISPPFSNFRYVEHTFRNLLPLKRIFSQIRMQQASTMILENIESKSAEDILEEDKDLGKRYKSFRRSEVHRLSFFDRPVNNKQDLAALGHENFLGYVVIKRNIFHKRTRINVFESVVKPSRHVNNFIRGAPLWRVKVVNREFEIYGYLYCQQNRMTNKCAHVALRTAVSAINGGKDICYHEINQILGISEKDTKLGGSCIRGLSSKEIRLVLEKNNAKCFDMDYIEEEDVSDLINKLKLPYQKYIYGSIESGFPSLVGFKYKDKKRPKLHIIPIIGHTFNEDTFVPRADMSYFQVGEQTRYIPSESWVSTYIAHDDNLGSHFCIPRQYLKPPKVCMPRQYLHIPRECSDLMEQSQQCGEANNVVTFAMSIFPRDCKIDSIDAETIAMEYLEAILIQLRKKTVNLSEWQRRLLEYSDSANLILRPLLIKKSDYFEHLRKISDWGGRREGIDASFLDDLYHYNLNRLWMVEFSVPELFQTNRRKLGEILLRADLAASDKMDSRNFAMARTPGELFYSMKGSIEKPSYASHTTDIVTHTQLYGCEGFPES